jgi:hypothetical protein
LPYVFVPYAVFVAKDLVYAVPDRFVSLAPTYAVDPIQELRQILVGIARNIVERLSRREGLDILFDFQVDSSISHCFSVKPVKHILRLGCLRGV